MLPSGVESKVEQYLNTNCRHPCARSHSKASIESATASAAAIERLFSATTPASQVSGAGFVGRPRNCTVASPPLASVLAMSLAPVKSSAMTPRSTLPPSVSWPGLSRPSRSPQSSLAGSDRRHKAGDDKKGCSWSRRWGVSHGPARQCHHSVDTRCPPSTGIVAPVIQREASEQRSRKAPSRSSGCPSRRMGMRFSIAWPCSVVKKPALMSVAM